MFYPIEKFKDADWKDYVLLMPAVSVGNVGQLVVDLLLSSLDVEFAGYIHGTFLLPLVGANPFVADDSKLVTSCQVYVYQEEKMVIVQQRSPAAENHRRDHRNFFCHWMKTMKFKKSILLSSSFAQFQCQPQNTGQGIPLKFLCTSKIEDSLTSIFTETLGWEMVKKKDPFTQSENCNGTLLIPGGGMTKLFFEDCENEEVPLVVLILSCSEGNNIPDALYFAECLNKWIHLVKAIEGSSQLSLKIPVSWKMPYGNDPPKTIY